MLISDAEIQKFNDYFKFVNTVSDLDDYSFVFTNLEMSILYVTIMTLRENIEKRNTKIIDYQYITRFVNNFVDSNININDNTTQKLIEIAYKKIINNSQKNIVDTSVLEAMDFPLLSESDSISLEKLNLYSKNGYLFSTTNLLQEFILKYRIGLIDDYKKYELGSVKVANDFYLDVASICHELGYTDKLLEQEEIDNILFKTNARLKYIDNVTTESQEYNNINYLIQKIENMFNIVNTKYKQGNLSEFEIEMTTINTEMHILDKLIAEYNIKYQKDIKNPFREKGKKKAS